MVDSLGESLPCKIFTCEISAVFRLCPEIAGYGEFTPFKLLPVL